MASLFNRDKDAAGGARYSAPASGGSDSSDDWPGYSSLEFSSTSRKRGSSSSGPRKPNLTPEEQNRRRARLAIFLLLVIVGVAFGAGWNPPTKTVHKFTKASDYNPERESGCTNSGAGCHGSETSYNDFNKYHPNAECLDCHDYQGVACIPCHMPTQHECQLCHDGSMKRAADVVRITDPFPKGHYRETTHTATATKMDAPVVNADGGTAQATCRDCHSRDLRKAHTDVPATADSPYGTTLGCGDCHNDVRSFGQAEVVANWKSRTCEACHKVGGSTPMHAANVSATTEADSPAGCGESGEGCHQGNQLHALHPNAPKDCSGSAADGEPVCHTLGAESLKPTSTTCGGTDPKTSCHVASGGTYAHKKLNATHSPKGYSAANDSSFYATPCGDCHYMAPNGRSLITEHALGTSARTGSSDECRNCHSSPASADAIAARWPEKSGTDACQACHGRAGLGPVHEGEIVTVHTVATGSAGCASSGPGCHPTDDISEVGEPTTSSGIHRDCLRCHDKSAADGNRSYNPSAKTCGSGRDCHAAAGAYDPATSVHDGSAGRSDGNDSKHVAGSAQRASVYTDPGSGISTQCGLCHSMVLGTEHGRPRVSPASAGTCTGCHNNSDAAEVVKSSWSSRTDGTACSECHGTTSAASLHGDLAPKHVATEIDPSGIPTPGSCVKSGCHSTLDLRKLHRKTGCTATGCHQNSGDILGRNIKGCGGGNVLTACHVGYSADNHFVSHDANLTGSRQGVVYVRGSNEGCFGCHDADLQTEHARELAAGSLDGTAVNGCRVCHADSADPGSGTYAADTAVVAAISKHDLRCTSCHSSGTAGDTAAAVASPHRQVSSANPLPAGKVWADPFGEWKAAFDSATGSGHNDLSAGLVGGSKAKRFPITQFAIRGADYTWALPPNSGATTWLKASVFGTASVESTEAIRDIMVGCDDCHAMPADMTGPHGASVHVGIDPAYSQTEYANPTPTAYQFRATGTQRVVCMKCHDMSAAGGLTPGGNPVHARHVAHDGIPASDPQHYGSKCVDCHVRIPHAWKRPRLLVRTAETTDGVVADKFPYVSTDHNGLAGIVLRSFETPSELRSRYCATGGCHPGHSATRHPLPSEISTSPLWP